MSDYIKREDAINEAVAMATAIPLPAEVVRTIFEQIHTADVRENVRGEWIKLDMHAHLADHKCSACGQECYVPTCMGDPMYVFCPNCGAEMRGDKA